MEVDSKSGEPSADLIADLDENHESYEFCQAVRLLQTSLTLSKSSRKVPRIGNEALFRDGKIRFRSLQSLSFPPSEITEFRRHEIDDEEVVELTVAFLGLTGPTGVLPAHYSSLVIERCHPSNKDYALRDFFDLFNHRAISLFFRACEKYNLPFVYERARYLEKQEDSITSTLASLVGIGVDGLRNRTSIRDEVMLYYSGLFANRSRSGAALEQVLTTYFETAIHVEQFRERWLFLPPESCSGFEGEFGNMTLGQSAIAGSRIKDIQSLFRIKINLKSWSDFLAYLPGSPTHKQLVELTYNFAGIDLDFEVQLMLPGSEVPGAQLTDNPGVQPLLGWTTWLGSPDPDEQIGDAVFRYGLGGVELN